VICAERKGLNGQHWAIIVPNEAAEAVWQALLEAGKAHGLIPAGSLIYNALRIRAGRPAVGRELSQDYIPLEAGLWDEVNFSKGLCRVQADIVSNATPQPPHQNDGEVAPVGNGRSPRTNL